MLSSAPKSTRLSGMSHHIHSQGSNIYCFPYCYYQQSSGPKHTLQNELPSDLYLRWAFLLGYVKAENFLLLTPPKIWIEESTKPLTELLCLVQWLTRRQFSVKCCRSHNQMHYSHSSSCSKLHQCSWDTNNGNTKWSHVAMLETGKEKIARLAKLNKKTVRERIFATRLLRVH